MSRRLACIAIAILAIGCSDTPTLPPTRSITEAGEIERSNDFWERNSEFAPTAYRYDSLAEITADSHLIVRGRIVGTQDGELQPLSGDAEGPALRRVTLGIVSIDEVLKGTPEMQVPDAVLVARLGESQQAAADIPDGEFILFLMHYPRMRAEAGLGPSSDPNDRFYYARPNGYQGVLRNLDGVVRIVDGPDGWEAALGPFPAPLDGEPFADVVEQIRKMVAST